MRSNISIKYFVILTIIFSFLNILGCSHTYIIQPNELSSNYDQNILVYANDGKVVKFAASEYKIDTSDVLRTINGQGIVLKDSLGIINQRFSGAIEFAKIDSIQVSTDSPMSNGIGLGIIIVGSSAVLLLILASIGGPFKLG